MLHWFLSLFNRPAKQAAPASINDAAFASHDRMQVGGRGVLANTHSMEPQYTAGDMFTVVQRPFLLLRPGDVVLAWWPGRTVNVPHRVLRGPLYAGNGAPYFVVKGDNNVVRDPNLTEDNYIGVCRFDKDSQPAQ